MRVLVAEDDSRLLMQLDSLFQQQGFSVDLADDGEKALFQLKEVNYDLAVIDIGLPKLDGFDVASHRADRTGHLAGKSGRTGCRG